MKDKEFESIIEIILKKEGYKSEDSKGGETIWGVSLKYHPEMKYLLNESWTASKEKAKKFYYQHYYLPFSSLPFPLRLCVVDAAVQFWTNDAVRILQTAINELLEEDALKVDGIFGEKTKLLTQGVYIAYRRRLILHYTISRIRKYLESELFPNYGKGWIERTLDIMKKALESIKEE